MRWIIYFNEYWYPLSSIQWCLYAILVAYMLFVGSLVFYLNPDMVCYAYMPYIIMCGLINRAATRPVASMDSVAGAETCFSFAWANVAGFLSALVDRITCKKQSTKKRWGTQGAVKSRTSILQLPNVLMFFTLIFGVFYGLYVFFTRSYNTPWDGGCGAHRVLPLSHLSRLQTAPADPRPPNPEPQPPTISLTTINPPLIITMQCSRASSLRST